MEKLLKSIGKILEDIVSSKVFWLIIVAVAAFSLVVILTAKEGERPVLLREKLFLGQKIYWEHILAIAIGLLLVKVVSSIAQQKELMETLCKIIQGVFSAQTFWLIVVALTIFGVIARFLLDAALGEDIPRILAMGGLALILAKVVLWVVRKVIDRYFL